jgi:hypothetical protein
MKLGMRVIMMMMLVAMRRKKMIMKTVKIGPLTWLEGSNNDNNNGNEKRERERERERGRERKKFFCGLGLERSDLNRVGKH